MTVTRTLPPIASSISARSRSRRDPTRPVTTSAASFTSNSPSVGPARDVEGHAGRTCHRRFEERRGDRCPCRLGGAVLAFRLAMADEAEPASFMIVRTLRNQVDEPGNGDQVGDALDALAKITLSAIRNASTTDVCFSTTWSRRACSG